MKSFVKAIILVLIFGFMLGAAYAQFAKPEDAIEYRKSVMVLMQHHFNPLWAFSQGKAAYDKDALSADADLIAMLATLPWEAFMEPGTDKGDTRVTSAVFNKKAQFKEAATSFEMVSAELAARAKGGDPQAIKAQIGAVGGNCYSCHKQYRK